MIGSLSSFYAFWMHLEVLGLVSHLYRALIPTQPFMACKGPGEYILEASESSVCERASVFA